MVEIWSRVSRNHLLRKNDAAVDFNHLYEMVEPLYSRDDRCPGIDPIVLFKMVLIWHLYGVPSLHLTALEVRANIYYRWFLSVHFRRKLLVFLQSATTFNTKKQVKKEVPVAAKHYAKELMKEVNAGRNTHGKKLFDDDDDQSPAPPEKRKRKS